VRSRRDPLSAASTFLARVLGVLGSGAGADSLRQWTIDPVSDARKAPAAHRGHRGWLTPDYPANRFPLELP
jgi:hypothetical protein